MPHSKNQRWTDGGTKVAHLNSKGARKFDANRSKMLEQSQSGFADKKANAKSTALSKRTK